MAATANTNPVAESPKDKKADPVAEVNKSPAESTAAATRTAFSTEATKPGDPTALKPVTADKPNTAVDNLPKVAVAQKDATAAPGKTSDAKPDAKPSDHLPKPGEQAKAPILDRKTLEQTAEELRAALTRKSLLGLKESPDKEKVTRILGPLTQADRRAVEQIYEEKFGDKTKAKELAVANADKSGIVDHTADFQSSSLRKDIASKFNGPKSVEQAEVTAIMNRVDGKTNDAGALMVAINKTRGDGDRGNVAIRAVFETLNEQQIKDLDQNFKRDYGKTWKEALQDLGSDVVTPQTVKSLDIFGKGVDKRTPQDVKDLAAIAIESKDSRLLGESLRGDSPAAVQARRELLADPKFMKDLTIAFPVSGWSSEGVQRMYERADSNGNAFVSRFHGINVNTLLDPVARDYLTEGRISLKTITTQDTGKWLLDSRENVALAAKNVSESERQQFTLGEKLTADKREPQTQEEKDAKNYYDKIHTTFVERGSPRETAVWESLLKHGRDNIVTEMAGTRSEAWGPFGWGAGHKRQDLMSRAENLSQKDYDLLRDPVKGKEFRQEIEQSLTKFSDEGERTRIMRMLDEKAAKPTYEESKNVHRSITETIADNKGSDFIGIGTSYDAKNILNNFTSMTPEDAAKIKSDPAVAKQLREFIKNESEFSATEQLLAQRLIDKAEKTGAVPKPDELDKLLKVTVGGDAKPPEILAQAQKALEADPALRLRLSQPNDQQSPEDRVVRALIVENYQRAQARTRPVDQNTVVHNIDNFVISGRLSVQDKLNLGFDRKSVIESAAAATPAERAATREKFSADENKVIDSAAANGGKLSLADRIQLMNLDVKGGDKVQDFKPILEQLHKDKDGFVKLQQAKDEFIQKYGRSLDDVVLSKVEPNERSNFQKLLTPTESDGRQSFHDNVWTALRSDSGTSADGTYLTMQKSIDQTANSLEEYQRIYKTLPPEKQKALDEYFNQSFEQHKQSKEKLAELVITATITAAALAAAPFTMGASAAALAAYAGIAATAGAAFSVGTHWAIEGNDYSKDKVLGDLVHGAVAGGLIFAIPPAGSLTAVFGQGAKAIVSDTAMVAALTGVQAAERAAVESALAQTLMQTGKNITEKQALELLKQAAPSLTGETAEQAARLLTETVKNNYNVAIQQGVTALEVQATEAGKNGALQFGKQVTESTALGAGGNAIATLADAPFSPNGLDMSNLLTQTLVGATVGAIMPVAFKGIGSGTKYVLNISKETNANGITEAVVHARAGEPVKIRHANGTVETVTGKATLRNGDQIVSGPEAPAVRPEAQGTQVTGDGGRTAVRTTTDGPTGTQADAPASGQRPEGQTAVKTSDTTGGGTIEPRTDQPELRRNEKGQLVNERNQLVNEQGKLVNEQGKLVNPEGKLINERGRLIDDRGQTINEHGQIVDSKGNLIEAEFPTYPKSEFDRVRPQLVDDLRSWKTLDGKNVGEEFDNLAKKLDLSESEKNQILDGLQTVREHGARMRDIDPEQAINWKHTEREFGAAVDYAARNNFSKAETQDLLLSAMFSDGLKTKFNFTTHNVDGATAFEHFAKTHLGDLPADRLAGIKQAILEHQVAPPEFMAMIYGGAIQGSIKAEGRAITDVEAAALKTLQAKISNPLALGPDGLIDVPGAPAGAKAVKLTPDEQALLQRSGLDHWYVPNEGNAWNKFSRGLIDADGIDNYAGPGGLSKIIGLRGPGKASFFQDRHVLYGNPENPSQISSVDSWKQSQRDFLGDPKTGKLGVATAEARQFVEQQSKNMQANIEGAQGRVNEWVNSPQGRAELGLPAEGPIDKIPGWTGSKDKPDLIDYSTATQPELDRARKIWDRFGDELGREQRVNLRTTPEYTAALRRQNEQGRLVNERGQTVNDHGQIIDSKGNLIEAEFPTYPKSEFDRVRPQLVDDLHSWKTLDGKNVGEEFDNLAKKLNLSESEKNQILDGLQTVREHGARMRDIDPEQAINWKHTEREFGAAVDYAARNNFSKAETQDLLLSAMFSDGLKTKFNFTTHNVDGATAFEHFAKTHLGDLPADRLAGIKQAILEHQVAPPEFMATIYGDVVIPGSIKAEGRALTEVETAALKTLKDKISNPLALGPDGLIQVPGAPAGAKAVKLTPDEQALLKRTGLDHWYVPHEGNAWNKFSRGLIDADGIDNYAGPGGLSKIIGLRGPSKAPNFQDRHVLYGNPENSTEISSVDSWKKSQRDFLGDPKTGKLGVATEEAKQFVEQQSKNMQANIDGAQGRVNEWVNSPAGRAELGLPAEGPIDKIPGWTGSKDKPDLIDYKTATPEELSRARKIWDRFGDELGREQRVNLRTTPEYTPSLRRQNEQGRLVNERGQTVNERGQIIDSKGNLIESEFPAYPQSEFDRVRPQLVDDLHSWKTLDGKNVGEEFDNLAKKLDLSESEKNQILDGLQTVREHGARMREIDPEQAINWKHTEREFGAAIDYAARNNFSKAETQDLLLSAMFSDGLKTKFNFTTHNVDGATAFEHFAKTHLKDLPAERIAGIKQAILEHQVAPPEFMAMIYGGAIQGSIKAENRAITDLETAALNTLKAKISNPLALGPDGLIEVPGAPKGAKAVKLTPDEQALLRRTGLDHWYVPNEGNAWNRFSRGLIDADGIDNYAGPGGLSKIIGLRGPGKMVFFQDRHVMYGNPENPTQGSSVDSWKQSQRDFLGDPKSGKLGVASAEAKRFVEQQSGKIQASIDGAQARVNEWVNSPAGRAELGLPAEGPIDKIPGWTGTKEKPDLIDYSTATQAELDRARKLWDRFGDELGREQRVNLRITPEYSPLMQPGGN